MTIKKNPSSLLDLNLKPFGRVCPSPSDWRDQVLYFLLPDRFSDGLEDGRPLFDVYKPEIYQTNDMATWMAKGKVFQGGTLQGIKSKLDYLEDLGATALWIGPVWKQRLDLETYHGYGIQNFLDVDPRFGTADDLTEMIDAAHSRGMYVLLDVVYNHTGNNWFYDENGRPAESLSYRFQPAYDFHGWRSFEGSNTPTIVSKDDGVWPIDFQDQEWYTRAGRIGHWDPESWEDPMHPDNEFRRGDFFDLKDLNLTRSDVLSAVIKCYQYWIAKTDCDGFRIDTVKHIPWDASRNFCGAIREYAESIGKENFLLLGEVTGGSQMARNYLDVFGRNIDAVIDIGEPASKLERMVKGDLEPHDFFGQYEGHDILGSHRETGRYHVSVLDDHDMVGREKKRFAAGDMGPYAKIKVAHAIGTMITTLGIPCIYYGTEQAFDGSNAFHDKNIEPLNQDSSIPNEDRYIRESMFGGTFGAHKTSGCHFFDSDHPTYLRIAAIAKIRKRKDMIGLALRRGRQYMRHISINGEPFEMPKKGDLIAWSRIIFDQEVLIAINSSEDVLSADVVIDSGLHESRDRMTYLYKGDWNEHQLRVPPFGLGENIKHNDGLTTVHLSISPAGMVILA